MKKINCIKPAFISMSIITMLFIACQKNTDAPQNDAISIEETTVSTEADAEADVNFDDVFVNVMGVNDEVGLGGNIGVFSGRATAPNELGRPLGTDSTNRCFTVSITPNNRGVYPKKVIIDFGSGCLGRDGHTRRGKIVTNFTGRIVIPGSKATTTFDGYYVDSVKVTGTHSIINASSGNNRKFTELVENGKLSKPSGNYVAWNSTRTREQTEGNRTPNYLKDDVFSITGKGAGTVKRGEKTIQWASEITRPIIRTFECRWATKGQITIKRNDKTSILDYGNGTCNNKATLTINGNTSVITLR